MTGVEMIDIPKGMAALVDRIVEIEWRANCGDWTRFWLLDFDEYDNCAWIRLRQVPDPNHDGDAPDPNPFWTRMRDIETISEVSE